MTYFPLFYDDFLPSKFNFEDWIFHSVVICGPGLRKRDGIMETKLATITDGYPLRSALLFEKACSDGADLK